MNARDERFAGGILILNVVAGSQAQGLSTADSDLDTRGVCIPGPNVLIGLTDFAQWSDIKGDQVVYSLRKFVQLALEGNPNIIETLYTDRDDVVFVHPELGQPLLDHRDLFLSKNVGLRFSHYALGQLQRIERHHKWLTEAPPTEPKLEDYTAKNKHGQWVFESAEAATAFNAAHKRFTHYETWRRERNPKRAALEAAYGYDTKHASHLCRLLNMGVEILAEGEVRVRRPDAEFLLGVRAGSMSYGEILAWAQQRLIDLQDLVDHSALPERPDSAAAEQLVMRLHRRALDLFAT